MIEVILLERIERLGQLGQVVKVRPGFARNFLLPHSKAMRATKANIEQFEQQRAVLEAKNAAQRAEAEKLGSKLDGIKLIVIRQASDSGHLYGSVTARDIAEAAKDANQPIERQEVYIDMPIKTLGLFPVKIKLHPEVTVKVTINVARSQEEAKVQAEKGAAVIKAAAEAAAVDAAFGGPQPEGEAKNEAKEKPAKKAKKAESPEEGEEAAPKAKKPRAKKATEV